MAPEVDAVVVAYASEDRITGCLSALRAVEGVEVASIRVVDHGDGSSGRQAETAGAAVTYRPENPGFGAGQNEGVAAGSAPYLLLVNPDAIVDAGAIARGVAYLASSPGVAMVQGAITGERSGALERSHGRELGPLHLLGRALGLRRLLDVGVVRRAAGWVPVFADHAERGVDAPTEVATIAATAPLIRRSAFEAVGGFSPRYFMYGEDLDLCRRLRGAGWTLVALPGHWATHGEGASSGDVVDRELLWWRGTLLFAATWWSPPSWWASLPAAALQALWLLSRAPRRGGEIGRALLLDPLRCRRERRVRGEP